MNLLTAETQSLTTGQITTVLVLLIVVAVVALISKVVRLPYTLSLVIAGLLIALTPGAPQVTLTPDLILFVFLPALLFEGAYNLDARRLRESATAISVLALPGVLVTAALIAAPLALLAGLGWPTALIIGVILSATDPISVLAIFKQLGAPRRLTTIVEGESLFNDGTSLVLFNLLVAIVVGESVFNPVASVAQFVGVAAGGLALGVAAGVLMSLIIRRINDHLTETVLTVIVAYGSFLIAETVHVSPALAVVAAGLVMGNYGSLTSMSATSRITVALTWEFIGFVANSLIFLLVGLQLNVVRYTEPRILLLTLLGIGAMVVSRIIVVPVAAWLTARIARHEKIPARWQPVIIWGGLRGSLSLALALGLPVLFADREVVLKVVFGAILFSLLVQGLTMSPLLRLLKLVQSSTERREYERMRAQLQANQAVRDELVRLEQQGLCPRPVARHITDELDQQRADLEERLLAFSRDNELVKAEQILGLRRRLLQVRRDNVRSQLAEGMISDEILRDLLAETDTQLIQVEEEAVALDAAEQPLQVKPRPSIEKRVEKLLVRNGKDSTE